MRKNKNCAKFKYCIKTGNGNTYILKNVSNIGKRFLAPMRWFLRCTDIDLYHKSVTETPFHIYT